jgi:hypothetical protein
VGPFSRRWGNRRRWIVGSIVALILSVSPSPSSSGGASTPADVRTLDGSANNLLHPDWGRARTEYLRLAAPHYADGVTAMEAGPSPRYVSNRVFNDVAQNIFSENRVSQWGWLWGQFLDHTFGLRDETPGESAPIAFDARDPLEQFTNDFGAIDFSRTPAAPGTGVKTPRQQINTVSSYIDAATVYGATNARLEWLRKGPVDGTLADNKARLLLPGGYLPRATARGSAASAPAMDLMGMLVATPANAVEAGDVRANENIALTAVHTLFAREHNRIVAALPANLSEEEKFQIARRVIGAEEQYITYTEFLPSLGVRLARYRGYDPTVNAGLSNEFATVGYRGHSMIHGTMESVAGPKKYAPAQLARFRAEGIAVQHEDGAVKLEIPLNLTFGNPDLLQRVGLGPLLRGFGTEREYRNDEMIDNQLRSVLFEVPKPGVTNPSACLDGPPLPDCFSGVADLGAIDIQRGRDHGMPTYNELRRAYGLAPQRSFTAITGERTTRFPRDPAINGRDPLDDPSILDFVQLEDADGKVVEPGTDAAKEAVVSAVRRTTLAARLRAIYRDPGQLDAFVGMLAEPHLAGSEFGELQLAIWTRQFEALRDGDRFFYLNDPYLNTIALQYGIDYRHTLAEIIDMNTNAGVAGNVFKAPN